MISDANSPLQVLGQPDDAYCEPARSPPAQHVSAAPASTQKQHSQKVRLMTMLCAPKDLAILHWLFGNKAAAVPCGVISDTMHCSRPEFAYPSARVNSVETVENIIGDVIVVAGPKPDGNHLVRALHGVEATAIGVERRPD